MQLLTYLGRSQQGCRGWIELMCKTWPLYHFQQLAALLTGREGGSGAELGTRTGPMLSVISTMEMVLKISIFHGISGVGFLSGTGLTEHNLSVIHGLLCDCQSPS